MIHPMIAKVEETSKKTTLPTFAIGDTVTVNVRIAAGDKHAMRALFARQRTPVYRRLPRFVSNETLA